MKKEILNVAISFGAIALVAVFGTFAYQEKDLLYVKAEEYQVLASEYDIKFDQMLNDRERMNSELMAKEQERERQEELARANELKTDQIQLQNQQALLVQKQKIAAEQAAADKALQDQITADKARQQRLASQQAVAQKVAVQKTTRKSRAS